MDTSEMNWNAKLSQLTSLLESRHNDLIDERAKRMELERRYHHQLRTTVAIRWLCPKHDRFLVEERGDRTAVSNGEDPIEPTTSVGTTSETGGHIRKCHTDGCRVQSVAKCTFPQGTCFVSHATHETAVLKIRHAVEKLCDKERRNIDRFAHIVETYFKQKQSQTVSQLKTEVVDLRRIVREEEERLAKEQESKNQLEACVKRLRHASGIRQRHLATEEAQLRSHVQALNDLRRRAPTEIAQLQSRLEALKKERDALLRQEEEMDARIKTAMQKE